MIILSATTDGLLIPLYQSLSSHHCYDDPESTELTAINNPGQSAKHAEDGGRPHVVPRGSSRPQRYGAYEE